MSDRHPHKPFTKQGPKRRRRTRRSLREGGFSQWGNCVTHFKREREAKREREVLRDWGLA